MEEYIIRLSQAVKNFGGVKALKGVSLDIKRGEIHCLAGENGCGKSTLIKLISGVYSMDGGTLEINGRSYEKITPSQAILEGIQVIYQDFSIFPNLSVRENLAISIELAESRKFVSKKRLEQIALEAIGKIGFEIDLDAIAGDLSVADKQLIAISRALFNDAKLIIMDEPTTALTEKEVEALFHVIKDLQKKGISILFVSHKLDEVFEISERYTILRNGENVSTGNVSELDEKQFSYFMTGRNFEAEHSFWNMENKKKVLEVTNLSLKNGYDDINFELFEGEILGITGLLGSGRTELMESIFGYRKADSGEIWIDGKPALIHSASDAMELGIGYVPEDRLTEGLFLECSIEENISVAKWDDLTKHGIMEKKKRRNMADESVKNFNIVTDNIQKPVQTLSGGNQQKVILARWLARDLRVLILNGPTVGVDIGAKYDIHELIRKLAQNGMAVIVLSDDLPEVFAVCGRIMIMNRGKIRHNVLSRDTDQAELASWIVGG